jgi:hypothetical protein
MLGAFRFIDKSTFDEIISTTDWRMIHDANQVWALAIAVRCSTACAYRADAVDMAWKVFEYHLHEDMLCLGRIKNLIMRTASLYFDSDYTALLQDARRLFRIALDKVVPDEDWLDKCNIFDMAPVEAERYARMEYDRLRGRWE